MSGKLTTFTWGANLSERGRSTSCEQARTHASQEGFMTMRRLAPRHPRDAWILYLKAPRIFLVVAAVGLCGGFSSGAHAAEFRCAPTIVRWAITSGPLLRAPAVDSEPVGSVSKGAMLAVLPIEPAPEDWSFIFVKPIGATSQKAGWIEYASTAMSLTANHLSDRGWNSTAVSGMPILVQRLPEAQREDWRRHVQSHTTREWRRCRAGTWLGLRHV